MLYLFLETYLMQVGGVPLAWVYFEDKKSNQMRKNEPIYQHCTYAYPIEHGGARMVMKVGLTKEGSHG